MTDLSSDMDISNSSIDETTMGNNGTTPAKLIYILMLNPSTNLLVILLSILVPKFFIRSVFLHAGLHSALLIFSLTVLQDIYYTIILPSILCAVAFMSCLLWLQRCSKRCSTFDIELPPQKNIPFLADYRGHVFILTCFCILAVDFPVFPSYLAKTEMYGLSLMDGGVGSFVAIHGICSAAARAQYHTSSLKKEFLSSLPLLILGFIRYIILSSIDYSQNVSEYGIHWNFFFTLALTKMICATLLFYVPYVRCAILALCLGLVYQWILLSLRVPQFFVDDYRGTFFTANKEGICSLLGFAVLYLEGVELGRIIWRPRRTIRDYIGLLISLLLISICCYLAMNILHEYVQPVSRKMANMGYTTWMVSMVSFHISLHLGEYLLVIIFCSELEIKKDHNICNYNTVRCYLCQAINYNGLLYFLFSNILTGVINLTIDTSEVSNTLSLLIIYSYMFFLFAVMIIMFKYSIRFKVW